MWISAATMRMCGMDTMEMARWSRVVYQSCEDGEEKVEILTLVFSLRLFYSMLMELLGMVSLRGRPFATSTNGADSGASSLLLILRFNSVHRARISSLLACCSNISQRL